MSLGGVPVYNYRSDVDSWTVNFKEGTPDSLMQSFCAETDKCVLMGHPDEGGQAFVEFHGSESEVIQFVLQNPDMLDFLEPDELDFIIPEIDEKEESEEDRLAATASWGLGRVGVPEAKGDGAGVHIYVADTGIRTSHVDFQGRAIPSLDMTSGRPVACDGNTNCAKDGHGHGTHCAGTTSGNSFGVAPGSTVHAVKTLRDNGSGSRSWQYAALDWITANGAAPTVISMSLGGSGTSFSYTRSINAATNKGVVVVVAAGNSNRDACGFSPAFVTNAITVGATDSSNRRASYSNYGTCVNIFAPGSGIRSASSKSDVGSAIMSGTSMACPHVSGGAALQLEASADLKRSGVMTSFEESGKVNFVNGRKSSDPNLFLWVGQ